MLKTEISLFLFLIVFLFAENIVRAQYNPIHISNDGIYDFLDELATWQVIELNTSIKPYSRSLIAKKLSEAEEKKDQLTPRQIKELHFYIKDYFSDNNRQSVYDNHNTTLAWINKPKDQRLNLFSYKDSVFRITVDPILGGNIWLNENGTFHHWWNGLQTHASYGGFSLFASLRNNHESTEITSRDFMNQRIGATNLKLFSGGKRDYWETRAGITYAWHWGHIGLLMDQFSWGDGFNGSNIFSGRTPAFTNLTFQLEPADWLQFNYIHGWLFSEEVDSTRSLWFGNNYGPTLIDVYHRKYLVANMFTFKPFNHFYIGVGNSVVYDFRTPHMAFFIPVLFWKALDHTLNAQINNMNSQIYFTFSSRNIKGIHLYGSAFIDEVQVGRIFREGEYNPVSYKIGTNIHLSKTLKCIIDYTWSNALIYRHNVPTTTFESNKYNLGHFLEDNARDFYTAIECKPWRTMKIWGYFNYSEKGPDHTFLGTTPRTTLHPLEPVVWKSTHIGVSASLQLINDLYLRTGYEWREITGEQVWIEIWTPKVYYGKTGTFNLGLNYGF